jgi:hypothetical protein
MHGGLRGAFRILDSGAIQLIPEPGAIGRRYPLLPRLPGLRSGNLRVCLQHRFARLLLLHFFGADGVGGARATPPFGISFDFRWSTCWPSPR